MPTLRAFRTNIVGLFIAMKITNWVNAMKMTNCLLLILAVSVLALAGCGKSSESKKPARRPGVVDLSDLQLAFPNPAPEVSMSLTKLRMATRYRDFAGAQVELDKLAKLPDLNDQQKKAVDDVVEQVKAISAASAAKPPQ